MKFFLCIKAISHFDWKHFVTNSDILKVQNMLGFMHFLFVLLFIIAFLHKPMCICVYCQHFLWFFCIKAIKLFVSHSGASLCKEKN